MIQLRIESDNKEELKRIATHLLKNKLVIDVDLEGPIVRLLGDEAVGSTRELYRITAKTKALLFPHIDDQVRKLCPNDVPELFSIPIVHMDWEQAAMLVNEVVNV